jgi:ssDNA-binding Zn-finger/Zn-ribbon topoisomerase 1
MECNKCGKPMKLKKGPYGEFWGCSGYPDCKNTQPAEPSKQGTIPEPNGFKIMADEFINLKNKIEELIKEIQGSVLGQ